MMTAYEFREAMKRLELKQRKFAQMTGYTEESISRYARGRKPVPPSLAVIVALMLKNTESANA